MLFLAQPSIGQEAHRGLLDFFKSFGSKAERDKAQQDLGNALTSLDIDVAIGAHQNWKDRLALYLRRPPAFSSKAV